MFMLFQPQSSREMCRKQGEVHRNLSELCMADGRRAGREIWEEQDTRVQNPGVS
jgi:hypothetical protein